MVGITVETYLPKGVCSRLIRVGIEDGVVIRVEIEGGCSGNIQALCRLTEGLPAAQVVRMLKGIRCGSKKTSCPDQLAAAIERAMAREPRGGK